MSERINIGGEILVEIKRKNGKREIFRHNMMTEFGRSFALSQGINKLKYNTTKNRGTLVTLCSGTYNTISPTGVGAIPPTANPSSNDTYSKLCNLLMNIPSGTITKKKAVYMPPSANLLAYAFRDTAVAVNEGYIDTTGDNIPLKNRVVTKYVYPSDLAGQFNCIAMSTLTPDSSATGKLAKVQRSIARVISSSNAIPYYFMHDADYIYLPDGLGKVNISTGEVTAHELTNFWPRAGYSQHFETYFMFNGFPMMAMLDGNGSGSYCYIYVRKADGTLASVSDSMYGKSMDGIFFKNGNLYEIISGTKYQIYVDSTTGAISRATTSDDLSDCYRKLFMPLSETDHISPGASYNGYFNTFVPSFNNVRLTSYSGYMLLDDKLMNFDHPDLYSLSWNCGYNGSSQANSENLLTEYGNILSFHQYDNPIVKNVGDELSVTYSYYMS